MKVRHVGSGAVLMTEEELQAQRDEVPEVKRSCLTCPLPNTCRVNREEDCRYLYPDGLADTQGRKQKEPTGIAASVKEAPAAYQKAYYEQNKERISARLKAWQESHKEERKAYRRAWRAKKNEERMDEKGASTERA